MKKFKFNDDFLFGGSINPTQCEGYGNFKKGKTVWDEFFATEPERFFNGVGPIKLNDFQNHYKDDIKLMRESGIRMLRYQIQGTAIFPDGKTLSKEGVKWYHDLFGELLKNDIKIMAPLVGFDTPLGARKKGGWASREVRTRFYDFAQFVFREFKDEVEYFATFIEPTPMVEGVLFGFHWPQTKDYKEAIGVLYGITHASALALKAWREVKNGKKIGAIFNNPIVYPASNDKADIKATEMFKMLWIDALQKPMITGAFSKELLAFWQDNDLMPEMLPSDESDFRNVKLDFVGVNYYQPNRIARPNLQDRRMEVGPLNYYSHYHDPNARMNLSRGWEIYPKAIYDACIDVANKYKLPIIITESGLGTEHEEEHMDGKKVLDKYRTDFYAEHLYWLHKAIVDKADVKAYLIGSPIDNWSWLNAYKNRYGLIRIDLNDLSRTKKASADIYKNWSDSKTVEWDDNNIHGLINQKKGS